MPDGSWSLALLFKGVVAGGPGSLGDTPYTCHIEARGPNGQVRQRLMVTAAAFHVMLRDADPAILMRLASVPLGHVIKFDKPGDVAERAKE